MRTIAIFGDGIAGLSAARILTGIGHRVVITAAGQVRSRCVALNAASCFLLERIWSRDLVQAAAGHALERRIVTWDGIAPTCLEDHAVVADVAVLCMRMKSMLAGDPSVAWDKANREFDIVAATMDERGRYLHGGARCAVQAKVALTDGADAGALLVEAVPDGWLVVLPIGGNEATLMGVGRDDTVCLDTLLAASKYCRAMVSRRDPASAPASAAPRLFVPSRGCGPAKRIGDAGMRLDPLSGDGIASALRGAHFAALLVDRRLRDGACDLCPDTLYERRLAKAMTAHLRGLARLYRAAPLKAKWAIELRAMETMDAEVSRLWPAEDLPLAIREKSLATGLSAAASPSDA